MKLHVFFATLSTFFLNLHTPGCDASPNDTNPRTHSGRIKPATITSVLNFDELKKCSTFVDKTTLVTTFCNDSVSRQFQLITAPAKFGKTINLYTIKRFLRTSDDYDDSTDSTSEESSGWVDLKIYHTDSESNEFLDFEGKFRVIYISFKSVRGNTYDKILNGISSALKACYESYDWLYSDLKHHHCGAKLESYKDFMNNVYKGVIKEEDISKSLFQLTKLLHETSGEKIVLLMDDYDQPVISAIEHDANVSRVVSLMENIISQVLSGDHSYVKKAIISGIHNILDRGKFGNIKHNNFLSNHRFNEYFGFTENEVIDLLNRHEVDIEEKSRVIKYYSGYKVLGSDWKIYNPWSIVKYLNNRDTSQGMQLENFWAEAAERTNLLTHFQKITVTRDLLKELLSCKKIKFPLKKNFNLEDLLELKRIAHEDNLNFVDYHADLFLSYLFHNGYLSYDSEPNTFVIPNQEIESYLSHVFTNKSRATFNKWKKLHITCSVKGMLSKLWNRVFK